MMRIQRPSKTANMRLGVAANGDAELVVKGLI